MPISRRKFIGTAAAAGLIPATGLAFFKETEIKFIDEIPKDRFDPWIEVDGNALLSNAETLAKLAGNRPIIAVVKNNSYGLGLETAPKLLEPSKYISGFGVVKTEECFQLLKSGIKKPIMLLALPNNESDEFELIRQGIQMSLFTDDAPQRMERISKKLQQRVKVHLYIDTGMNRVGMPYFRALPWMKTLAAMPGVEIVSTFTDLTEEPDFDQEQIKRLQALAEEIRKSGLSIGKLHAASSHGIYHSPGAYLEIVRPGISLFGAYPTNEDQEKLKAALKPAYRLRTRVVRVVQLRTGDSVSYGRKYIAHKPTWIATLPVGHTDGYPRGAVKGAGVLIGNEVFPVIGAVSASHCIVALGDENKVNVGDVATLIGPDHFSIEPNAVSKVSDVSVYDILMHMNPRLPKYIG